MPGLIELSEVNWTIRNPVWRFSSIWSVLRESSCVLSLIYIHNLNEPSVLKLTLGLLHSQKQNCTHWAQNSVKFENLSSRSKIGYQFWQQLCYCVATVAAALVAAWLLGSSSMHWKFNFDLFTFLKFENPSSCSKVEWQFWQQLCFWLAAVGAAWLLGSSSMHRKFYL